MDFAFVAAVVVLLGFCGLIWGIFCLEVGKSKGAGTQAEIARRVRLELEAAAAEAAEAGPGSYGDAGDLIFFEHVAYQVFDSEEKPPSLMVELNRACHRNSRRGFELEGYEIGTAVVQGYVYPCHEESCELPEHVEPACLVHRLTAVFVRARRSDVERVAAFSAN